MSFIGAFFFAVILFIMVIFLKAIKYIWIIFFIVIFFIIKNRKKRRGSARFFNSERNYKGESNSYRNSWSEHFNPNTNNKRWNDNNSNGKNKNNMGKQEFKIDREKQILLLASRFNGKLTISEVVMNSKLSTAEAEKLMKIFVENFVIETKISEKGIIVYNFPELINDSKIVNIKYNDIKEFEKAIFNMALKNDKRLSLSTIILKTSLTMKDSIKYMKNICERSIAKRTQTVHDAIIYDFPGILSEEEKDNAKGMWE